MRARHQEFPNHFDPNQVPWSQLGRPRCTRDSIENDQPTIGTSINKDRWNSLGRGSILSDLPLKLEWVCTRRPGRGQVQYSKINIEVFRNPRTLNRIR